MNSSGPVSSKKITLYLRIFVNMADSYLAAKLRKFIFSKELRIFAAKNFVSYVRKSREVSFALQQVRPLILGCFAFFSSDHVFWR